MGYWSRIRRRSEPRAPAHGLRGPDCTIVSLPVGACGERSAMLHDTLSASKREELMTKHMEAGRMNRRSLAVAAGLLPVMGLLALTPRSVPAQASAESTVDRVRRTKVLRIAALPGELPYFQKDLATGEWSGACISMAQDIAKVVDAKLEYIDSTYGNAVLDLQSNKVDLAFALNPTPARALSISFTRPMIIHPFGCLAKKGLAPKTWDDLNKPELVIVFDIGSLHETAARPDCPKAELTGFQTRH